MQQQQVASKSQERIRGVVSKPFQIQQQHTQQIQSQQQQQDNERQTISKKSTTAIIQQQQNLAQPAAINSFISLAIQANTNKAKLQGQGQTVQTKNTPFSNQVKTANLNKHKKPVSIGQYTLGDIIGRGAHGKVYKATDSKGDIVAVKLFTQLRPDLKQQISKEIALLKKLDHPNIVKYIDSVQSDQQLAIVLEFVESGSLEDLIKRHGGCFTETIVAVYIKQILRGLEYLHQRNIIHRDIKGANILTTKEGVVKVADFGVAMLEDGTHTKNNNSAAFAGTPYWMAPEVIELSHPISTACDIWSLGCTVFELLKGSPPNFDLNPFAAMSKIVQDTEFMLLPEGLSPALTDFLNQCFKKNPEERATATELLEHRWLKILSDEQKIAKIMNLNLPQKVHNTIKVHLKKQGEKEQLQQNQEAPPQTNIEQISNSQRILSPSTLVEDKQAIVNIVKLQHFQSRNPHNIPHSLTSIVQAQQNVNENLQKLAYQQNSFEQNVESNKSQQDQQQNKANQQSKTNISSVLAQKNLIKLQTSRLQQNKSQPQSKAVLGSQQKTGTLIDLRIQQNQSQIEQNRKQNVSKKETDDLSAAPESQQVTEYAGTNDDQLSAPDDSIALVSAQNAEVQYNKLPPSPVKQLQQQVVSIQLKNNRQNYNQPISRNKSRLTQEASSNQKIIRAGASGGVSQGNTLSGVQNEKSGVMNNGQWQTVSVNVQQQSKQQSVPNFNVLPIGGVNLHQSATVSTKQFYSTTANGLGASNSFVSAIIDEKNNHQNSIGPGNDYFNQMQRSVPIIADHSVKQQLLNKSPQNKTHEHSQHSQDFHRSNKLNPDQQLHIYTSQVPKKSPHAPSAPVTQPASKSNAPQITASHIQQTKTQNNDFSQSHSNLIARKPNSVLNQQQQVRQSSQAPLAPSPLTVSRGDSVNKSQTFQKHTVTPQATNQFANGQLSLTRTPAAQQQYQTQVNSVFQTYDPAASSDQKQRIQQSRTVGTRTALSTLSAASYPTQNLLKTSSEQIMIGNNHHFQHKSLGLVVQKQQQTPQARQRSPTDPPGIRTSFMPQENLQISNDTIDNYCIVQNQNSQIRTVQQVDTADGEVDDQDSSHQLLFTQVLERSLARKPSGSQVLNVLTSRQPHKVLQGSDLKNQPKQIQFQQMQAISLAKEFIQLENGDPSQVIKKTYQYIKGNDGINPIFKEFLLKNIGAVTLITYLQTKYSLMTLQLINLLCESSVKNLQYFCVAGILQYIIQLVGNERKFQTQVALFVEKIFNSELNEIISIFISSGGLKIFTAFMKLEYPTEKDLIILSVDRTRDLLEEPEQRKFKHLETADISRLLIQSNILTILGELIPKLIRYADSKYRHGNSLFVEDIKEEESSVINQQKQVEKCIEKAFEILKNICSQSQDVRSSLIRSSILSHKTIQASIYECISEPTAITFTITNQFMKIIDACVSPSETTKRDINIMISQDIELILLEMLTFYMENVINIQLTSIYENLKLLNLLIKNSQEAVNKAITKGNMLQITLQLYNYLDVNEKSRTKRSKLFQVCCNLWFETCQAGLIKPLQQYRIDHLCFAILQNDVIMNQQSSSKKNHSQELAFKVLNLLITWQVQDSNLDFMLAENLQLIIIVDVPTILLQFLQNSQYLTQTMLQQINISQLLQMQVNCVKEQQKTYYEILLHLKQQVGLSIQAVASYIIPPQDKNDNVTKQIFYQLMQNLHHNFSGDQYDSSQIGSLDEDELEEDNGDISGIENTSEDQN